MSDYTYIFGILSFLIFTTRIIHYVISCVLYRILIQNIPKVWRNILPPSSAQLRTLMLQIP